MNKTYIILIIVMNLFNLFGCEAQNEEDLYWEFNEEDHYRPELNKGAFYKLTGYEFGWFVLEPISKFVKDEQHEIERGKALSYGQKTLYYWWYLDAQVTNGGFVQFYYNGYGRYVATIIKGLELVGDTEMANLARKADKIYQKNKKLIEKSQENDLFGSDLYDKLDKMSFLDDKYYEMNEKTMSLIEAYIRNHPNEICLDEDGKEFDLTFTGLCKTFYENKTVKEEIPLEQGIISGAFKLYYENGKLKEQIDYINGEQTGEREEFFENGKLKYKVVKNIPEEVLIYNWFYENGAQKKLETKKIKGNIRNGELKEWYDNGQLKEQSIFINNSTRIGRWVEFWKDGSKKLEAETKDGVIYYENYWNEKGEQTLRNGTGLYIREFPSYLGATKYENEYKNYLRHGKSRTIRDGVLTSEEEFKEGKEHGLSRSFYKNGNLKNEILYEEGYSISVKRYAKFENPKVETSIKSRLLKHQYDREEDYTLPDNDPKLVNSKSLEKNITAEVSLFEPYGDDHILNFSYIVYVNIKGEVDDIEFWTADNTDMEEEIENNLFKMKFEIALKEEKPIRSIHLVQQQFHLIE